MEKYKIVLMGKLQYDGCLRLDKHSLGEMIIDHLPPVPLEEEEHDFGEVKVTIEFTDDYVCPICNSIVRKKDI